MWSQSLLFAGLGSVLLEPAQSSYQSCLWSSQNKKFESVPVKRITPGLTDLLHHYPLHGSKKHRGTPSFCTCLLYNVHVQRTGRQLMLSCKHIIADYAPDIPWIEDLLGTLPVSDPFCDNIQPYSILCLSFPDFHVLLRSAFSPMLAPAKPHHWQGWDLVSLIDWIAKLRPIK
jgi:hypothetical protein